jgi:hypothetical protein
MTAMVWPCKNKHKNNAKMALELNIKEKKPMG